MRAAYLDLDAVVACADLVARAGGKQFELGYLEEDVPFEKARWYAQASFKGARLIADEKSSPDEAADALARRLIGGGQCTNCHRTVRIALAAGPRHCGWYREGPAWVRGCDGKRQASRNEVAS